MRMFSVAAALAAACVVSSPAFAIQSSGPSGSQVVACGDLNRVMQIVQGLGYSPQMKSDQNVSGVFFLSQGRSVVGITSIDVPDLGGCVGFVFLSPFGPDNGGKDGIYAKYNSSQTNGFGAVGGTFQGHSVLAHSMVSKYGSMAGNLELEIELFAERADAFAGILNGGTIASNLPGGTGSSSGFASQVKGTDSAVAEAMKTLLAIAPAAKPAQ